ncbi:Importin-7 [Halotydeus destructor]|nr:Importin-7 [Halotydeus destructor]
MTQNLAMVFDQLMKSNDEESEDKALTAMGLLNTIDTILTMMDDQRDVLAQLEPIVVQMIVNIFQAEQIDLYEEALNLVCTISTNSVSPALWKVFEIMYQVFNKDGFDYFTEMMPALHNFVTVDPEAFLSNPNHILALYNMCKSILNSEAGEDAESHAAKMLECMILQFRGRIDECIHPFIELVLSRLTREIKTPELRTMLLQVIIAALFYNYDLLMQVMDKLQPANSNQSLLAHFMKQWMDDTHCFQGLHDRKIAVLGLVTLMNLPVNKRPPVLSEISPQLIPSALLLFEGLKVAYQQKANLDNQSESEGEEEEEDDASDPEDLEDDEDHIAATIEDIEEDELSETDTDSLDDDFEQTALESYVTPLDDDDCAVDEYVEFKNTLETLQTSDPNWFNQLVSKLDAGQHKALNDVYTLAQQRKSASDSRKIEKGGGYIFANPAVPSSFNFGGKPIG